MKTGLRHSIGRAGRCGLLMSLLAAPLSVSLAAPAPVDGHELLARCRDERRVGACLNELIIIADMHDVVAAWGLGSAQWCMPEGVPPARLREIVLRFLLAADSDSDLDEPSTRLINAAYAEAFPCR